MTPTSDAFRSKGAVEQQAPEQEGNESMRGQLGHRNRDPLVKANDSDLPEPGENPEHTGEPELASLYMRDEPESDEEDPEGAEQDQNPGHQQKQNQGDQEEDPLAA